jgi:hypothetical protein
MGGAPRERLDLSLNTWPMIVVRVLPLGPEPGTAALQQHSHF